MRALFFIVAFAVLSSLLVMLYSVSHTPEQPRAPLTRREEYDLLWSEIVALLKQRRDTIKRWVFVFAYLAR
jgi:hypothetical protein